MRGWRSSEPPLVRTIQRLCQTPAVSPDALAVAVNHARSASVAFARGGFSLEEGAGLREHQRVQTSRATA
jgi:hypothetical protein